MTEKFPSPDIETTESIKELYNITQQIGRVFRTMPNIKEIREGEIFFYDDGVTRRLYTKLNNVLRYVTLT